MKEQQQFRNWLAKQGANILPATNPYEFARFTAHGGNHIVYRNNRGKYTASGHAKDALDAWLNGKSWTAGFANKARGSTAKVKSALIERDGSCCFFCGQELGDDITVEHLVAHAKGGPDHIDNFALAHEACNRQADNLPLIEKIKICRFARGED